MRPWLILHLSSRDRWERLRSPHPERPFRVTSDTSIRAHRIRFAVVVGETGRVFLGVEGMNKATGAGRGEGVLAHGRGRRRGR
jgi:hypothetical protein